MTSDGYSFRFAGETLIARPSGALWWPARQMLILADLHLGRSERYARRGGPLLPPFDVQDTLARLSAELTELAPARVASLGDAFDDDLAARHLSAEDAAHLAALSKGRDWLWIAGNHDPGHGGEADFSPVLEKIEGTISLRHIAAKGPDISGHMHPSTRLAGRRYRCFVLGEKHLILPAFGTYTGGLDITDPAYAAVAGGGIALVCADRILPIPMPSWSLPSER